MESALMQKFKAQREQGKKIGGFWLRMNARRICKRLYVARTPPHPKAARAASFRASNGWATRVVKWHDIVPRCCTNFKKLSLARRLLGGGTLLLALRRCLGSRFLRCRDRRTAVLVAA
eukprot:COSAG01_NODE_423_length_17260_cov_203.736962_7_plen_118_part_00